MLKIHFKITCCLLLVAYCLKAQINLVPNPSFEIADTCPYNQNQVHYANGWIGVGSPDYFNLCSSNPNFSTPHNWGGYQVPASGVAYCGLGTYLSPKFAANVREYVGTAFTSPLVIGNKYFVSFKTSLAIDTAVGNCATNNLGALFTVNIPQLDFPYPATGSYIPKINYTNLITDSSGWTQVFGSLIADSSYQYFFTGNFYTDNNTDTLIINNNDTTVIDGKNICYSYYYIDDVCVSTDSIFTANYSYVGINLISFENSIMIFPNPTTNYLMIKNSNDYPLNCILFDELSKKINSFTLQAYSQIQIDASDLSNGIYCLTIESFNNVLTKKIIKQ